jgi:hypothetical protein
VGDEAEHGANDYSGQDQGADDVKTMVPNDPSSHAQGRDHSAQHQGSHRRHSIGAEQAVDGERGGNVEDQDLRDRAEPISGRRPGTGGSLSIAARIHDLRLP